MSVPEMDILQFAPLQSFVSPNFWHKFAEIKLDRDRLSDAPKRIHGFYTNRAAQFCLIEVDYTAFNSVFSPPKYNHGAVGIMYNKNTIEDFKLCDKKALLESAGLEIIADFQTDRILNDPTLLSRFIVLSFTDLKSYNYYYWFAFPCPTTAKLCTPCKVRKVSEVPEMANFATTLSGISFEHQNYFIWESSGGKYYTLKNGIAQLDGLTDVYFCFADPSEFHYPSWLLRLYATFIFFKCPTLIGKTVKFVGVRYDKQMQPTESLLWLVYQDKPITFDQGEMEINFVGWEPNLQKKMAPRMVSMQDTMDPKILASNLTLLNLKLMKWRMLPELDLDKIASTKCLLFGAGTLGCAVARCLQGWGFRHITLIDNGRIGYSNPTRQCLYTHADAVSGKCYKATTAATRLMEINPNCIACGHVLQVPMPSHPIGEALQQQTINELETIKQLVEQHDVLFLLMDSRESRWLPTLLGAIMQKCHTAALGFDSFLVMRHGSTKQEQLAGGDGIPTNREVEGLKCIDGTNLSCYFCTNVTAPGDSLKDRTLDQQCTVSRPGVSNIASSYAVELLVSMLQHDKGDMAPAYYSANGKASEDIPEGMLGILPHTIRGQLSRFENILPATPKFKQCTACSPKVLAEYREHGHKFLFRVFESSKYLETLTGINEYEQMTNDVTIDFEDMTDDDDES